MRILPSERAISKGIVRATKTLWGKRPTQANDGGARQRKRRIVLSLLSPDKTLMQGSRDERRGVQYAAVPEMARKHGT